MEEKANKPSFFTKLIAFAGIFISNIIALLLYSYIDYHYITKKINFYDKVLFLLWGMSLIKQLKAWDKKYKTKSIFDADD